jgi:hypothetical protein
MPVPRREEEQQAVFELSLIYANMLPPLKTS